jgi:hypothetical protein
MRHVAMAIALLVALAHDVEAQTGRRTATRADRATASTRTLTLVLNGGVAIVPGRFTHAVTARINAEDAPIRSELTAAASAFAEGGVRMQFASRITLGAVGFFSPATLSGRVDAQLPHPFYFNQPRQVSGDTSGLTRREAGAHLDVGYPLSIGSRSVRLFGGPSLIRVEQALVTGIEYTDAYPFDTATFTGVTAARARRWAPGVNAGAETAWQLGRSSELAALVRYSRARVTLTSAAGDTAEVTAGGVHAGIGLRVRF